MMTTARCPLTYQNRQLQVAGSRKLQSSSMHLRWVLAIHCRWASLGGGHSTMLCMLRLVRREISRNVQRGD